MKIFDYLAQIPNFFNWYFKLALIKRIQLNYITLLTIVISLAYYNDKRHRENYTILSIRVDATNASRAQEQKEYNANLRYYTDKFNHLLELLIQQKEQIKQIHKES